MKKSNLIPKWKYYVYIHLRADTKKVFYVGKGTIRRKNLYERAYISQSRSLMWTRVARKYGYIVKIVASCKDEASSHELEKELIEKYGRRDLGKGSLVNFTDGGEGYTDIIALESLKRKRSIAASRKRSDKWVESIRASRKDGGNGGVVCKGDKLARSWRMNIAATKFGKRNLMYGKTGKNHPNSRKVVNYKTGEIYNSIKEASEAYRIKMKSLYNMLSGHRRNRTNLKFCESTI